MENELLIILIVIFIYIFIHLNKNNLVYVESQTGTKFLVNNEPDKQIKSDMISRVVENMYKIKNYLVRNIENFQDMKPYIKQLDENFNESRTTIYETDPTTEYTSYSVNKGEELSICLKSKKNGKIHDINLLMYVVIHEMAHFACPEIGHGELFKKIFRYLIEVAIKLNVYEKVDYNTNPVEYCGMVLSSSIV